MKRGEFNHAIIVLGVPTTGKSDYAVRILNELGHTPAYKLVHDPGWRVPTTYHDDNGRAHDSGIIRHSSVVEAAKALATNPGATHSVSSEDGGEVLALAEKVAKLSMDKSGNLTGTPVIVLLDEGVATAGASPMRIDPAMRRFLAGRRHKNVGLIMTAQDPRYIHYSFGTLCTELVTFRLRDENSIKRLQGLGVQTDLESIRGLPNYKYVKFPLG